MAKIGFDAKSAKLPVTTGLNGALFNVIYNKQLHCANIEPSTEQV